MDISLFLVVSFANIFSHSIGCLFVLLMVSFAVQKFLSWIQYSLFISFTLGAWTKKLFLRFISENVLSVFSFRSFMVSCLILRLFFFFFNFGHATQHVGSYFSDQGLNPHCLCWKHSLNHWTTREISLSHFEFIFCIWCEGVFYFDWFMWGCPAFQAQFAEENVFFHGIFLPL